MELLDDVQTLLLPVDRPAIERALDALRVRELLRGFRGRPHVDIGLVIDAIAAIAAFAASRDGELLELDVNPLLVTATSVVAADVLLVTRAPTSR